MIGLVIQASTCEQPACSHNISGTKILDTSGVRETRAYCIALVPLCPSPTSNHDLIISLVTSETEDPQASPHTMWISAAKQADSRYPIMEPV